MDASFDDVPDASDAGAEVLGDVEIPAPPVLVGNVPWNASGAMVGMVAALAEQGETLFLFGTRGMQVLAGGVVAATDARVTMWRMAAVIPAGDGTSGEWVVGVDATGRVWRLRNRDSIEEVTGRYALMMRDAQSVARLSMNRVAFGLRAGVAVADGTQVRVWNDPSFANLVGSGSRVAAATATGVRVFDLMGERFVDFTLAGVTGVAFDAAGKLVVTTAGALYAEDDRGALTFRRRSSAPLRGVVQSGMRTWLVSGSNLALWDGAADSLWSQPLMAMENPREHATTRLTVAHRVATTYANDYEAVFGPLPPLGEGARFPPSGMPGDPRWEAMSASDQTAVNRVVVNVGKAIEAYERTLAVRPAPFDRYVAGDFEAMSPDARDGLSLMLLFSCMECHNTPLFSDNRFHALRMPDDPEATRLGGDRGRDAVIERLLASPFNMAGVFSDARDDTRLREIERTDLNIGAFRTPTLRGVALTAPYGHAGMLATLTDVVRHDGRGGLPENDPRALGIPDPRFRPFHATDDQVQKIVAFLQALTPDTN
jgi:cytochrome c peroxidase